MPKHQPLLHSLAGPAKRLDNGASRVVLLISSEHGRTTKRVLDGTITTRPRRTGTPVLLIALVNSGQDMCRAFRLELFNFLFCFSHILFPHRPSGAIQQPLPVLSLFQYPLSSQLIKRRLEHHGYHLARSAIAFLDAGPRVSWLTQTFSTLPHWLKASLPSHLICWRCNPLMAVMAGHATHRLHGPLTSVPCMMRRVVGSLVIQLIRVPLNGMVLPHPAYC
jgi:hypothetical protein